MKYEVLKSFYDKEDELQPYGVGGLYPRDGVKADEDRVKHLAGLGFIESGEDVEAEKEAEEVEEVKEVAETTEMTEENTKQEIMDHLDDLEIDYKTSETKKDLLALLDDVHADSN